VGERENRFPPTFETHTRDTRVIPSPVGIGGSIGPNRGTVSKTLLECGRNGGIN
jgi:hypothetical protein